jgi:hypothetical protein
MRARFAAVWILLTAVVAGIAAWVAYGAGIATKVATTVPGAADGAAPAYYYGYHPFFWGFPFFGFFGFLFVLFVLFAIFRGGRRGWHRGRGYYGMGPGGGMGPGAGSIPPGIEERLKSWHEAAHSQKPTEKNETAEK